MSYSPISDSEIDNGSFWTETLSRKFRDNIEAGGPPYTAGDYLLYANDTERSQVGYGSYVKAKEIKINRDGGYRIKFDLRSSSSGYEIFGKIYKNGIAVGTERAWSYDFTLGTFSEDLSGFVAGDLIQIFGKSSSSPFYVSNFRIYCADEGSLSGY